MLEDEELYREEEEPYREDEEPYGEDEEPYGEDEEPYREEEDEVEEEEPPKTKKKWIVIVVLLTICCLLVAGALVVAGYYVAIAMSVDESAPSAATPTSAAEICPNQSSLPPPRTGYLLTFSNEKNNTAAQSSNTMNDGLTAMYPVDGNVDTCTNTDEKDEHPWWKLDMNNQYLVINVSYAATTNSSGENDKYIHVRVGNFDKPSAKTNKWDRNGFCGDIPEAEVQGHVFVFTCPGMLIGRYLTIQKYNATVDFLALTVCKVTVYGVLYEKV